VLDEWWASASLTYVLSEGLLFVKIGSLVLVNLLPRRSKSYLLGTRAYLLAMLAKNRSASSRAVEAPRQPKFSLLYAPKNYTIAM
jgi:hypothetical protein